jgi:hypothetical protein
MKSKDFKADSGVVQYMRGVREQISKEIEDMTFEEERAFLDKLLKKDKKAEGKIPVVI